jgi:protein-S-isoprenylcysteine O-methyltransferase Ste14
MKTTVVRLAGAALMLILVLGASSAGFLPRIAMSVVIGVPAFILMIVSRRQLGKSFAVMPTAKSLVTTGLYSRIQHPMYVFLDLFLASVIMALDMPVLLWIWGILVIVQFFQSRREEAVLQAAFGAEYEAYAKRTWM